MISEKIKGLTSSKFLPYLNILITPFDVAIIKTDLKNHIIEINGADNKQVEFEKVLNEKLGDYLI